MGRKRKRSAKGDDDEATKAAKAQKRAERKLKRDQEIARRKEEWRIEREEHKKDSALGRKRGRTQAREEEQRALVPTLQDLLGAVPLPVVNIIVDYGRVVFWKLATTLPGKHPCVKRLSDNCARNRGMLDEESDGEEWFEIPDVISPSTPAFIRGDTAFVAGLHAWRVGIDRLYPDGEELAIGIAKAPEPPESKEAEEKEHDRLIDSIFPEDSFYGIETERAGFFIEAGKRNRYSYRSEEERKEKAARWSGLAAIRSGDYLDCVLDVDGGTFTIITLKDGKQCVFTNLPRHSCGWTPYFFFHERHNLISVEVIDPMHAGSCDKTTLEPGTADTRRFFVRMWGV